MSLNKFFNTGTGLDIDLRIGADEVKANNMQTQNIDTFTINGVPYLPGSGVTNPLTSNLKLDGFAIIEELASLSPSLNIDQLNNTKDIKLKIGGISKVDVKNNEITLNENLNMDNHEIKNVSVIDNSSGAIQIIGSSTTSAVEVDPNPSIGVNLTTSSKDINIISSNDLLLKSVSSILDVDSNLIRFISTGVPQGQIDAVGGWELANTLNMTNNNIINVNTSNTQQTQTELIVKPTAGQLPITATNGVLLTENNLPGGEIFESNVTENKSYKTLNMNNNTINNVLNINSGTNINLNPTGFVTCNGDIDMNSNRILGVPEIIGNGGSMIIRNGGAESIILNSITNTIDIQNNNLNMNNNNVELANEVSSVKYTLIGSDFESPITNIFRFNTVGGIAPVIYTAGLNMNNGEINNVSNLITNGGSNITLPIIIGTPSGSFQVQNGGAYIKQDLQVDGAIYCNTINNIRPSGGVYSESAGTLYAGNGGVAERPLLNQGVSYGSLMVPAGGFTAGDTYAFKFGGAITCINNTTFDLRICTNFTAGGGGVGEADFATINVQVDGAQTLGWWEVELEFNVRAIGGVGVGAISTNGAYVYFNNTDVQKGYGVNVNNTTTFDTTIGNDLQVGFFTAENAGDLSVFRLDQVSLTKLY
jgi:hypothetical protein